MTEENKSVKNFPNLLPKLRFTGFEDVWEEKKLGDIGDVKMCRRIFNDETSITGEIPFFKIGSFGKEADAFITKNLYLDYRNKFPFPKKGDILISAAGTIGRTVIYNGEDAYYQDSNIVWIENDNTKITNEFLFHILQIVKYNTEGGTIQRLYNSILKSTKFSCPTILEQNRISDFLLLINDRILTQKKIIEDLQITKKEISFKLFKEGFNSSESKKENFQKLGDLTYIVNKKNKENLKLPVYSINNKKGFISQSEQFEGIDSDERGYDISLYKIIEKETFAYNPARINVGSIGYSGNLENIIISSLYVCFKTADVVDDEFLFHYLRTDIFRKEVLRNVEGGVRDYLFYENFSRIKINLPDLKEQVKIAHFLSKFDEKINLENELLTQYENQKKYLLQNLFV